MVELNEFKTEIIGKDVLNERAVGTINQIYYTHPQSREVISKKYPKELNLSRNEIFNTPDLKKRLVLILVWGYRTDVRNTPSILDHLDEIVKLHNQYTSHKIDGEGYLKDLLKISCLGLSTASKILYFMKVKIDEHPCVIVDARVESALSLVKEFAEIKRGKDVPFYKAVIGKVDELANAWGIHHADWGIPHANIEYFLYKLGIAWDFFMSSIRSREALAVDKQKLVKILNDVEKKGKDKGIEGVNKEEDGIFPVTLDEKELNKSTNHYPLEGYRFHHGKDILFLYVGEFNQSGVVFCEIYLWKTSDSLRGELSSSISPKFEDHSNNTTRKYYIYKETSPDAKAKMKSLMESLKEPIAQAIWGDEADKYLHTENS